MVSPLGIFLESKMDECMFKFGISADSLRKMTVGLCCGSSSFVYELSRAVYGLRYIAWVGDYAWASCANEYLPYDLWNKVEFSSYSPAITARRINLSHAELDKLKT